MAFSIWHKQRSSNEFVRSVHQDTFFLIFLSLPLKHNPLEYNIERMYCSWSMANIGMQEFYGSKPQLGEGVWRSANYEYPVKYISGICSAVNWLPVQLVISKKSGCQGCQLTKLSSLYGSFSKAFPPCMSQTNIREISHSHTWLPHTWCDSEGSQDRRLRGMLSRPVAFICCRFF